MPRPKLQNAWAVLPCGAGLQTASQEVTINLALELVIFHLLRGLVSQAWEVQCCFVVGSGLESLPPKC